MLSVVDASCSDGGRAADAHHRRLSKLTLTFLVRKSAASGSFHRQTSCPMQAWSWMSVESVSMTET